MNKASFTKGQYSYPLEEINKEFVKAVVESYEEDGVDVAPEELKLKVLNIYTDEDAKAVYVVFEGPKKFVKDIGDTT